MKTATDENMDNNERVEAMIALVLEASRLFSGGGDQDHTIYHREPRKEMVNHKRTNGKTKKRNASEISIDSNAFPGVEGGVMTRSMRNKKAMLI
jgi:hypothetical protein